MADTYELIASTTVGSGGASSIDFSSIPNTFTDLVVHLSGRSSRSNPTDTVFLKFNNTNSTYSTIRVYSTGTSVGSDTGSTGNGLDVATLNGATSTSSFFSNQKIYIPSYTSSNKKTISYDGTSSNNSTTGNFLVLTSGQWSGTSTINQITLTPDVGSFVQYSTAYLYGVKSS